MHTAGTEEQVSAVAISVKAPAKPTQQVPLTTSTVVSSAIANPNMAVGSLDIMLIEEDSNAPAIALPPNMVRLT